MSCSRWRNRVRYQPNSSLTPVTPIASPTFCTGWACFGGAHSRHTKHMYRDIYSQKSSWGLDAVTCFRTWCHTQDSTHTREQPDQDNLHTGQQHGTVSGRQQPATRLLLQPGAQPGPSYCCWAVLCFVFETLCFFLNNFPVSLPEERLFLDIPRLKLQSGPPSRANLNFIPGTLLYPLSPVHRTSPPTSAACMSSLCLR